MAGRIEIEGRARDRADPAAFGRLIQYVFQDPVSSLNPRKTIRQIIEAPLHNLHGMTGTALEARIAELFDAVNLRPEFLTRYPHEFSGGQAQRIGIARELAASPRILILDEPVSALDVSVQARVLNQLADLKARLNLTHLFISHDLAVVEAVSDRIAVLYFGSLVESGPAAEGGRGVKSWVMDNGWGPGTRLPSEAELIDRFAMAKGTIREAIRILEAQGLVKSRTGPGGGVFVHQVSEERETARLGNYFDFEHLTIDDICQIRQALEPELAASLAGRLSETQLAALEEVMTRYAEPARTLEEKRDQHVASLRFHALLAEMSGNPPLRFPPESKTI